MSGPMSGPVSSGQPGGPISSGAPPASSGLTLELALSDAETKMLRDLCKAMGYDAVQMVKHALLEAHQARFGS